MNLTAVFDRQPDLEFHSITVLRSGHTVLERTWLPYRSDDLVLVYSVSKTFTATAVGFAIAEGRFAVTDRVVDLLPAEVTEPVDPAITAITVHHLLSMSTGHDTDPLETVVETPPQTWVRGLLAAVPQAQPGSRHVYNSGASFLLGELVRQHTGQDLLDYLQPRLLEPLGITATWDRDPLGRCLGWTGLHLTPAGLAAMGELYRCDGWWQGRQLLPAGWVQRATVAHIPTPNADQEEWRYGYGYQLWLNREGFRLDGAYGQYAVVLPDRELVVVITSAQTRNQRVLDFVFDELIPALPAEPAALPTRQLIVPSDTGEGERWTAASAVPEPGLVSDDLIQQFNLPILTDLDVVRGQHGWRVRLVADGEPLELEAGLGQWRRQQVALAGSVVPLAAVAGSGPDGSLTLLLVFTDTPHTLELRLAAGRASMAWRTPPLRAGGLDSLRAV